jgi:hypothetical protein
MYFELVGHDLFFTLLLFSLQSISLLLFPST